MQGNNSSTTSNAKLSAYTEPLRTVLPVLALSAQSAQAPPRPGLSRRQPRRAEKDVFTKPPMRLVTEGVPEPVNEEEGPSGAPFPVEPLVPAVSLTREALLAHGGHADPLRRALAESMARSESHSLTVPAEVEEEAKSKAKAYMGHRDYGKTLMTWDADHEHLEDLEGDVPAESYYGTHSSMSRPRTPTLVRGELPKADASMDLDPTIMDKTLDVLTKFLSGDSGDPDVTALSEAIKARLGITSPLVKPEASPSPGVKTLAENLMGDRRTHKLPEVGSCPSPFHPRIRTVPATSLEETPGEDLNKLGLTSLAPLAKEPPPSGATGRKPIAQANITLDLPEFDPKNLPEWAEDFQEFLLLTGQANADVETKCSLIRKSCKKRYLQRQVKLAIKRCQTWGEVLQRLERMFPVYETDLSVRTAIEELPMLPEFPSAARISEFVCDLEYQFSRLNPGSFGPTEPHLWLVGKIPPKTWEDCRSNSERKRRTHTYEELVDLLVELALERENDTHMDHYLRKHLGRGSGGGNPGGNRNQDRNVNPSKGGGGKGGGGSGHPPKPAGALRTMQGEPGGKPLPPLFYCRPVDDKGGPCHAPDCDGRAGCLLQLKRQQKSRDGQVHQHQDHFRCTITCGYCGKRRHYEDECHIKKRHSEKLKKEEEEKRKSGKGNYNPSYNQDKNLGGRGRPFEKKDNGGRSSSAPTQTGNRNPGGTPTQSGNRNPGGNPNSKGEKRPPPTTPKTGDNKSKEGGETNAKKRRLAWMAKSLKMAGVDVKFPEEE